MFEIVERLAHWRWRHRDDRCAARRSMAPRPAPGARAVHLAIKRFDGDAVGGRRDQAFGKGSALQDRFDALQPVICVTLGNPRRDDSLIPTHVSCRAEASTAKRRGRQIERCFRARCEYGMDCGHVDCRRFPKLGASACVWRDGRVLIVQRGKPPLAGVWSLPGGAVEPGETCNGGSGARTRRRDGRRSRAHQLVDLVDIIRHERGWPPCLPLCGCLL